MEFTNAITFFELPILGNGAGCTTIFESGLTLHAGVMTG